MARAVPLPLVLLLAFGLAFAARALGLGTLAFDDHPGQLARLWHLLRAGPAPWAWNDGWWAGYAELQFYPPGWFYLGAALSWLTLGAIPAPAIYQTLLWITYLAPGVAVFVLLRRVLDGGSRPSDAAWAALPGAFVALAFTGDPAGGAASAVEGGVHIGMVSARLAWAMLPLLALTLTRWTPHAGRFPRTAIVLIAAIVLTHPTHAPAALAIVGAAVLVTRVPARALVRAALGLVVALLLIAFWMLPLIAHLGETRALAWGAVSASSFATPFTATLLALALLATRARPVVVHAVWLSAVAVALVALVIQPLGVHLLPADRVADGGWMTLLIASGVGAGILVRAASARVPVAVASLAVCAGLIAFSLPDRALALWARAADWPTYATVARGLRLDELWGTLRAAPPGRVLYLRSGVPLVYGTAWYRPHTHVTALTPVLAGREILNGTFTHGSPVAAFVYRGDAGPAPLTRLAEQLDGESLFGRPLAALDAATFEAFATRFHVATVVALEEDAPRLPFLTDNPRYRRVVLPPFLLFVAREPRTPPRVPAAGTRELTVGADAQGWISTGIGYAPLWRAMRDGGPLATRRSALGDLEVETPPGTSAVRLVYGPGTVEIAGAMVSAGTLTALAVEAWRARRRRSALGDVPDGEDADRRADGVGAVDDARAER